jgi:hypothetical protein
VLTDVMGVPAAVKRRLRNRYATRPFQLVVNEA